MPAMPRSDPQQFIQGAAVLHVRDVEATARYYRDVLGFTWDFGDEVYSVVWRDNSALHLVKGDRDPQGIHLFQWVRNVDACHDEMAARGAEVTRPPADLPYGLREFAIRDVNGIDVVFGQDIY